MALISTDPIIIDETGYQWDIYTQRQRVLDWTTENLASGNEAGGTIEQFLGNMAEHLLSMELTGIPIWEKEGDGGWDYENPGGVRFDIKCRGGNNEWQNLYLANDNMSREGKHNLYARQLYNPNLEANGYIFCHMQKRSVGRFNRGTLTLHRSGASFNNPLRIWVRGWISRERCHNEQVFTPRGSISERGSIGWMEYQDDNVEIYDHNLVRINQLEELSHVTNQMITNDAASSGTHVNLSTVDACRIAFDLYERGILSLEQRDQALAAVGGENISRQRVAPFLCSNQYHAFMRYAQQLEIIDNHSLDELGDAFNEVQYTAQHW